MLLHPHKTKKGFTLIELSIVLVIIGLIIGGVLIGQDLIKAAETRSLVSQLNAYNSAVNSFRSKYNALPGDFAQASTYISATATNGDGNGIIFNAAGAPGAAPTTYIGEMPPFWYQLSTLGLIDGSFDGTITTTTLGTNAPFTKMNRGGIIVYGFTDYNNYYHIGAANSASTTIVTASNMTPTAAYAFDLKMDDGLPASGIVQSRGGVVLEGAASTTAAAGTATACNVTGGTPATAYNTQNGAYVCQLRVKMP
jgi:prepilin-type N-terminal cleavage/methylation domain-containing protein